MPAPPRRLRARLALVLLCAALSGCAVAARQTIQTVRGGYSDMLIIQPVAPLHDYRSVEFLPLTSDVGGHAPAALLSRLHAAVNAELGARGATPAQGRVLRLRARVIHVELKPRSLHKEIIVRVTLLDGAGGRVLGVANVLGQAGGVSDLDDLATGLARGIVSLLAEHGYPGLG